MSPNFSITGHEGKKIQVFWVLEIFNATLFCAVMLHALILELHYVLLLGTTTTSNRALKIKHAVEP
jgi:hypothetical protein